MRRRKPRLQPYPVGDPLDQPARTRVMRIILEAVHHLVADHAEDLRCRDGGRERAEVPERDVDLLMIDVQVRGCGIGDAVHIAQNQGYGALAVLGGGERLLMGSLISLLLRCGHRYVLGTVS